MIVLVVDSSVQIIERLQHLLLETGKIKTVFGAVSFKDATRFLRKNRTDVVLLDGALPGSMSFDLLTEIKTSSPKTAVIIMVNRDDQQLKAKYKLLGADLVFDKYHEFEEISYLIDTLISKKKISSGNEKPKPYTEFA